jgi:hypothetical protein
MLGHGRQSALGFGPAQHVFYGCKPAVAGLVAAFQFKPGLNTWLANGSPLFGASTANRAKENPAEAKPRNG